MHCWTGHSGLAVVNILLCSLIFFNDEKRMFAAKLQLIQTARYQPEMKDDVAEWNSKSKEGEVTYFFSLFPVEAVYLFVLIPGSIAP